MGEAVAVDDVRACVAVFGCGEGIELDSVRKNA